MKHRKFQHIGLLDDENIITTKVQKERHQQKLIKRKKLKELIIEKLDIPSELTVTIVLFFIYTDATTKIIITSGMCW